MAGHTVAGDVGQGRKHLSRLAPITRERGQVVECGVRRAALFNEVVRQARMVLTPMLDLAFHADARGRSALGNGLEVPFGERHVHAMQRTEQIAHLGTQTLLQVGVQAQADGFIGRAGLRDEAGEPRAQRESRSLHASAPSFSGSAGSATHSHIEPS